MLEKFQHIVLKKILTLFFALFVIVGAIIYYWIYAFYIDSTKEGLLEDVTLLSFELHPDSNLTQLAKHVHSNTNLRLTIIDANGDILAESDFQKEKMENHRYRPEIMQADLQNYGFSVRTSATLHKKLLYVAKKFTLPKQTLYIRLAKELNGVTALILNLGIKILAVIVIFFFVVVSMTYKINTQIQYETRKIAEFLKSLTRKNKATYISSNYSEEFAHITSLLTKISQILVKKENQKEKYTKRLQESNKQKDDIISAISHEFKNPIAVVNGYSQTLLEDENIHPNIRKKFLMKIHKNGTRLSELIDTLRLSMKLDGEQQTLTTRNTNLYELIDETAQNLILNYPHRHVIIEGDTTLQVPLDATLFSVVLTNLIENAFKYSEDEVHIRITKDALEVIDTGIGIDAKDVEKITQKFYRVHTNSWNNSLGLGLFLVNKIVSLHNFKLVIQSKVNEGTTFRIIF